MSNGSSILVYGPSLERFVQPWSPWPGWFFYKKNRLKIYFLLKIYFVFEIYFLLGPIIKIYDRVFLNRFIRFVDMNKMKVHQNKTNAKSLGKECNTGIRRIRESMWIRRRGPLAMNRDERDTFLKSRLWFSSFFLRHLRLVFVQPERRRNDQHHSEDGYRPGYLKLSIRELKFLVLFW